jgi:PIN like domain
VRVLLDESIPRPLAASLGGHEVQTVVQAGWAGVQNGELLRRGLAAGFQALITKDRNLEHQQNIPASGLALLVILARDNRVETVVALAAAIKTALEHARPGEVLHVGA